MNIKKIQLVNISRYAELWKKNRSTIHDYINNGNLTIYETPKGNKFLNPFENPNIIKEK